MIKLTGLWKKQDKNGNTYYSGTLGGGRIMVMKNIFKEKDNQPDLNLFLAEPPKQENKPEPEEEETPW